MYHVSALADKSFPPQNQCILEGERSRDQPHMTLHPQLNACLADAEVLLCGIWFRQRTKRLHEMTSCYLVPPTFANRPKFDSFFLTGQEPPEP